MSRLQMTGPGSIAAALLVCALAWPTAILTSQTPPQTPPGFTSLFDGKTLTGWQGDPEIWSVRDGVIRGGSTSPIPFNTFLISNRTYGDFELRYKYRFATPTGNSGLQFRSGQGEGNHVLGGLQANVIPAVFENCGLPSCGQERFGMLYEELNRGMLATLGDKVTVTRRQARTGGSGRIVRTIEGTVNPRDAIIATVRAYPEWNEIVLIAVGDRLIHIINGRVAFDVTDKDPLVPKSGLIGMQVHAGNPMAVEFMDIAIRELDALPDLTRFATRPGPPPDPAKIEVDVQMAVVQPSAPAN
jgi:hypothetical protein